MKKNNRTLKAGAAQWDIKLGDIDHNLERVSGFLDDFSEKGVKLAVLPEMYSCGFDYKNLDSHSARTPEILELMIRKAAASGMTICGSLPERKDGSISNTLYVIGPEGIKCTYSKIHLFTPSGEDRYFISGSKAVVCRTDDAILGLVICYDLRFPELCRALALAGAEIIVCCAQWPVTRISHWNILLAARAVENQVFVVASNRCGKDCSVIYGGSSKIISPYGNIIAECHNDDSSAVAGIDFMEIDSFRSMMPCLGHIRPEACQI